MGAWAFGFALAGAYAAGKYVPAAGWTTHDVTTGASAAYPELRPRVYDASPENAAQVAAAVASRLPGWKVLRTDVGGGRVTCEAPGAWFGVNKDEVIVVIQPAGASGARVTIRAHARLPGGDLGSDARHIRDLQVAMDDKLPPLAGRSD